MKPLVSIVIPSYNHSKYIIETLDSVFEDTYPNKEIVIIDDGSKDNSPLLIKNWIQNNTSVQVKFIARENRGICDTLNELVDLASGKYILLLASDDYLLNNTIEERVEVLETNPTKLVLISDAQVIDFDGNIIFESCLEGFHKKDKKKYYTDENLIDEMLFNFGISGAVVLINKDIYTVIGKYPKNLKAEDLYFYSKVAILKKLLFYDKIVSGYRVHETNTSGNKNPEVLKSFMDTYIMIFYFIPGFARKLRVIKNILWIIKYISFDKKMRNHFLRKINKSNKIAAFFK